METMELGGNISISGFSGRDFTELIVVKKLVGQYARKFSDGIPGFTHLSIVFKEVHHSEEGHGKVEIIAKADVDGHEYAAEVVDRNLFFALDASLRRVLEQAHKAMEKHH